MKRIALAAVVLVAACGGAEPRVTADAPSSTPRPPDTFAVEDLLIGCHHYGYPPSALSGPTGEENADDPAAIELRKVIEEFAEAEPIPETGWRRLYDGDDAVVFGAIDADEPAGTLVEVTVERTGDGFDYAGSAHGCVPTAIVEGRSLAEFEVAPGAELTASSTAVAVLVTERACTGSAPVDDRLGPPAIHYGETSIDVLFTAEPLEGDGFTCPGNPSAAVAITLDEPLGDRQLRDLSTYPPRDATEPLGHS